MAHQLRQQQKPAGGRAQTVALAILRVSIGVFMLFEGFERVSWLLDAGPLAAQLASWLPAAPPVSRWFLERVIPGAPIFARLVPLGSMAGGFTLALGFWTRMSAALLLLIVLSLQLGAGAMFRLAYLSDAGGLPLVGALVALVVGGEVRKKERNRKHE